MRIETQILFVVEYENGGTARMKVVGSDLDRGDYVVRKIARERQREGKLPKGKIRLITRDPPN